MEKLETQSHEHSANKLHASMEILATLLFPLIAGSLLYITGSIIIDEGYVWALPFLFVLGWLLGDFISGLVHWFFDTYGTENTPIFGQSYVRPFRRHHTHPHEITEHNFFVTIGNTCIAADLVLGITLYSNIVEQKTLFGSIADLVVSVMAIATVLTNQFHKWAHEKSPRKVVQWLMKYNLTLTVKKHQKHHTAPFRSDYCITGGWLNPMLNKIKFFAGMERVLGLFGLKPSDGVVPVPSQSLVATPLPVPEAFEDGISGPPPRG